MISTSFFALLEKHHRKSVLGILNNLENLTITGRSIGTFQQEIELGVLNEIQPGSYLFNDVDFCKNLDASGKAMGENVWKNSLRSLSTVMNIYERCIDGQNMVQNLLDTGHKAMTLDSGNPQVYRYHPPNYLTEDGLSTRYMDGKEEWKCRIVGDEHMMVERVGKEEDGKDFLNVGGKVEMIPGHCDPTVNLHNYLVAVRKDKVEHLWLIDGRSPGT